MTVSPQLNTHTPNRWAQVVSGETWAEYGVGPAGMIEAKIVRGPLIMWATKTGDGESLPRLHAPTPSPLEVQAARVNVCGHFLAFVRAAHGKVRHSVRWKTGRRQLCRAVFNFVRSHTPFQVMGWPAVMKCFRAGLAALARKGKRSKSRSSSYRFSKSWLTVDKRTQTRVTQNPKAYFQMTQKYLDSIHASERARLEKPKPPPLDPSGDLGWADEDGEVWEGACAPVCDWERENYPQVLSYVVSEYHFLYQYGSGVRDWLNVSLMAEDAIGELLGALRRPAAVVTFLRLFLKRLQAVAYRAHVTRRARPPARRACVPRPLYARPRPPTAPLAPPVTC